MSNVSQIMSGIDSNENMKLLLVCSSGGHFNAMQKLSPFWVNRDRSWVTFLNSTTEIALKHEQVCWAFSPTNRNLPNLIRNFWLAWKVLAKERPQLIVSTGAGVAIPFLILGKWMGCQTVFVESITRIQDLSLSAKVLMPFLDALYVYWKPLQLRYPQVELIRPYSNLCHKED